MRFHLIYFCLSTVCLLMAQDGLKADQVRSPVFVESMGRMN